MQVEQALQELAEENRLAEAKLQASQQQLERDTTLTRLEAEFKLLTQQQENMQKEQALAASLARQRQESLAQLELEEAANQVKLALAEREVELSRLRQEVRNLMNNSDLAGQLIEKLPELAARMPEIQELKVLQTGDGNAAADALANFLARTLAIAESLGVSLPGRNSHLDSGSVHLPDEKAS
jgi:hypothetical protein